jgi:N-acylglucosamine 2-epimerase
MKPSENLDALLDLYTNALLDDVMPWWLEHGVDYEYGGVTERIYEDGRVADYDKPMWSLGRALFVFSRLYRLIGARHEWLEVAEGIFHFIYPIGEHNKWVWPQTVTRDGRIREPAECIYADGFAIMGLTEYAMATGDDDAMGLALATFETVEERSAKLGTHLAVPEHLVGRAMTHGISMIFSTVYHALGAYATDVEILRAGHEHAEMILDIYRRPERKLLPEYAALDGSELDAPEGKMVIPGHVIESMWFGLHIWRDRGEPDRISQALECLRWHLEAGWDEECGGIFSSILTEGQDPKRVEANKLMWPQTEALYALLLAYEMSGEQWCLDWYDRVHEWAWTHLPVPEYGEWHRQVARDGSALPDPPTPGNHPRKEPFHLPRSLMMCIDVLRRLTGKG